jgi:tRNA threonylcarbamoyladenosine modification (KEOPS) complex Cgi121 subunit
MWVSGIKDSPWFVAIGGFRVKRIKNPKALVGAVSVAVAPHLAQIVDAKKVAGREHLFMAAVNASKSTETGMAVSKSITVETLLYASAQDQITKAIRMLGVSPKSTTVALIVFAHSQEEVELAYIMAAKHLGEEDDRVLEIDDLKVESLKETYEVGDEELEVVGGPEALGRLIVERGALLSLRR